MEKALRFFGICIIIASACISVTIFLNNQINSSVANEKRYIAVGGQAFDTILGEYIKAPDEEPAKPDNRQKVEIIKTVFTKGLTQEEADAKYPSGKLVFGKYSSMLDKFEITVQNKDSISHVIYVLIAYYDKSNAAIATDRSGVPVEILSGEIKKISVSSSLLSVDYYKSNISIIYEKK